MDADLPTRTVSTKGSAPDEGADGAGMPEVWLEAESLSLSALVHHANFVACDCPLEQVSRVFAERGVEFLALVRDDMVTGLCSRSRLGNILSTRFGFALYSRSAAHLAQVQRPLVFSTTTPVREVLDRALARQGGEFREDVVLVDEKHALVGMIPIDALARLQNRIASQQMAELQRQHEALRVANEALRQSQGRYAGLFESPTLGMALLEVDGAVHTHNQRFSELLNLGEAVSGLTSLAAWIPDADRADFVTLLRTQRSGGETKARELSLDIPGRGLRLFRYSLGWIEETHQICLCLDDITEQRTMERQLARQEKQTLLDTLVGGIAHELNNKLTPVQGFSELIAATADEETRGYASMIIKSVREAAKIIQQLLQLSRPVTRATRVIELRDVVDEAVSMMRFQIRESNCLVRTVYSTEPTWIQADPAEIKQVVMNLVLNAIQAMGDRSDAVLDVEVKGAGHRAVVVVEDNGIGIPAENLERIFDPFFTTKGPERGTGLGLSVCYSIVRQHGGEIAVKSQPGHGARFTISLPREMAGGPRVAEPRPEPAAIATPSAVEGTRVLVVEDEIHVRRLMRDVLAAKFGCEVDTVSNGIEALERLAIGHYSLVLSDVRMPAMNGTELYLWLREAQPATAGRFVFVTGYPGESHLNDEMAEWNVPVLSKPFSVTQLTDTCTPFLASAVPMADSA